MRNMRIVALVAGLTLWPAVTPVRATSPMGTAFSYQGQLKEGDVPANGEYDFVFRLFDASNGPSQVSVDYPVEDQPVNDGIFTVELDFGPGAFDGNARWLEVGVRPGDSTGEYTFLAPRQAVMPGPYALYAADGAGGTGELWAVNGDDIYSTNSGDVGVGTNSPNFNLEVRDYGSTDSPPATLGLHWVQPALPQSLHDWFYFAVGGSVPTVGSGTRLIRESNTDLHFQVKDEINSGSPATQMVLDDNGDLGIGTMTPFGRLHLSSAGGVDLIVDADSDNSNEYDNARIILKQDGGQVVGRIGYRNGLNRMEIVQEYGDSLILGTNNVDRMTVTSTGRVGIGTSNPAAMLDVAGTARVQVLELLGADVAEKFPVSDEVKPGMVVAIDPVHPGSLCLARGAYNPRVAGVVSGANDLPAGTILGNLPGQENAVPIALTGRVYVWADASNGSIEPGDLLTTSETPGHAMKATDRSRSFGATIGKAMSGLEAGRGLVLVLVNLQ